MIRGRPFEKGHKGFGKGIPRTEEVKSKISFAKKGQVACGGFFKKGHIVSEEVRKQISLAKKGEKHSEEQKLKISEGIKKYYDKKGRKEHKRYYHLSNTREYKQWRSNVFQRDNWTCQTCNIRGIYLIAHHLKSWAKFPELRYKTDNGITLCEECHKLTDNYKGKNK